MVQIYWFGHGLIIVLVMWFFFIENELPFKIREKIIYMSSNVRCICKYQVNNHPTQL
jgi:hypothetical protein